MPIYEYRRKDGSTFEVIQKFSDDPLTECPTCAGALKKKFGSVGIAFKGSGFYQTDYRSGTLGRISLETPASRQAMLATARSKPEPGNPT